MTTEAGRDGRLALQYWFFYPYNDYTNKHEGDWEMVQLLLDTNEHPGKLKDMVTSPGGTAIAGLHTLEEGGLRTTLINAVETATKRSRELGRGGK